MSILNKICDLRRQDVAQQKLRVPINSFRESALYKAPTRSLSKAMKEANIGILAEHKRASPSEGSFDVQHTPIEIAKGYETSGASGLSVLTESKHFHGQLDHLREIRSAVQVPLLRKDFIVDPYQLHEAKAAGADAVLLMASVLSLEEAKEFRTICHHLGLEVLLEIHTINELSYLDIEPDIIGVNNRNLKTLKIDLKQSEHLYGALPKDAVKISESGIKTVADARRMLAAGFDGMLIGTSFMKKPNPGMELRSFLHELNHGKGIAV